MFYLLQENKKKKAENFFHWNQVVYKNLPEAGHETAVLQRSLMFMLYQ